jgi:hypothetical protein
VGGIIAPCQDDTAPVRRLAGQSGAQHAVQHPAHRQQIRNRRKRPSDRQPDRPLEIGPRGREQQPAAVPQHHNQLQPPPATHPPDQLKRAALQRVTRAHDPHGRREALEVGSVSCLLSIAFSTTL